MPRIKIHGNDEVMKGALMFFDKAVGAYIEDNKSRPDLKFGLLRNMRENDNLYLADVRMANPAEGVHHHEVDLVGFEQGGKPICFKVRMDENMTMTGFSKKNLNNMSDNTKEMAQDIRRELGYESSNPALK